MLRALLMLSRGIIARRGRHGPASSLFDVVMQHEADAAAQRASDRRKPAPSRSSRRAAPVPPTAAASNRRVSVVALPLVAESDAPSPKLGTKWFETAKQLAGVTLSSSKIVEMLSPSSSGQAAVTSTSGSHIREATDQPDGTLTGDKVLLTPLTPPQLRFRRRPRSARQEQEQQAKAARRGGGAGAVAATPSRQFLSAHGQPSPAALEDVGGLAAFSRRLAHAAGPIMAATVAAASFAVWTAWRCYTSGVLPNPAASPINAGYVAEFRSLTAGPTGPSDSESEVDRRNRIGSQSAVPSAMLESFHTPYWKPDAATVLTLMGSGCCQ